jgi:hypothetical protein
MTVPAPHRRVAAAQLFVASLGLFGVWVALPARYWLVDAPGTALALVCAASAYGLLTGRAWGRTLARVTSWLTLVVGAAAVSTLAIVAAHLAGLYGPVGAGGAVLMGTVAALIMPYLVGFPVLQLVWLKD